MKRVRPMSRMMKTQREEQFRQLCRDKGVPFTEQRRAVMHAMLELGSHPTADEIYASKAVRRAGVSRATVYRTLENLVQMGAVIKVGHGGHAVRYDGRVELHHHLVCLRCNSITDVASAALDSIPRPDAGEFGFIVKDFRVQLSGFCRRCLTDKQQTR